MKNREKDLQVTLKNLQKLVDELPKLVKKHPEIIANFSMEQYGVLEHKKRDTDINDCNTTGCLLGNSVRVIRPDDSDYEYLQPDYDMYNKGFSYEAYSRRVFPFLHNVRDDNSLFLVGNNLWNFLFHGDWIIVDNTLEGAIARTKYFIKNYDRSQLIFFDYDNLEELENFGEDWHLGTEYETKLV